MNEYRPGKGEPRPRLWPVIMLLAAIAPPAPADNHDETNSLLTGEIRYQFVGHRGQTDGDGRLLVWQADFHGWVEGTMKWWFVSPPPAAEVTYTSGRVSFYTARWELWVDGDLLLAGESAGKTYFPGGADGIWDGHGRVTEAAAEHAHMKGREIYETGPVLLGPDPPGSLNGTGAFVIY